MEGILLVHKPAAVTSHDVVQLVRRKLSLKRVGHTGTLDPMARGLLVLLVGAATKHQRELQAHEKTYEAVLQLGTQTDTGDATGRPVHSGPVPFLDRSSVSEALASFEGWLSQTPPAYSAVKVRGHPAYWWARRRQPVSLAPRAVHIFDISLITLDAGTITFRVRCSAGTYIRTLGEAIAQRLGTVGHLNSLVRLRVGEWDLEAAHSLEWIAQATSEALSRHLLPISSSSLAPQRR